MMVLRALAATKYLPRNILSVERHTAMAAHFTSARLPSLFRYQLPVGGQTAGVTTKDLPHIMIERQSPPTMRAAVAQITTGQ
ncbi:hypothetical protein [Bradyrhizobium sp. Gha]|uniref:hypothetical protein n=1 Tax=Bradyrhizobium sp. Gha TaxID=1855318 RepID=UPI001160BF1D|nr:hypothetical protein [Bradyrhizobium sp. Gha]